jgi:hypothetical protein
MQHDLGQKHLGQEDMRRCIYFFAPDVFAFPSVVALWMQNGTDKNIAAGNGQFDSNPRRLLFLSVPIREIGGRFSDLVN